MTPPLSATAAITPFTLASTRTRATDAFKRTSSTDRERDDRRGMSEGLRLMPKLHLPTTGRSGQCHA